MQKIRTFTPRAMNRDLPYTIGELPARFHLELSKHAAHLAFHCVNADPELLGDFEVAPASGGQQGDPPLAGGERLEPAQRRPIPPRREATGPPRNSIRPPQVAPVPTPPRQNHARPGETP